mmetsp:Transcript_2788/g.9863  ORF Transcript_2788/g.9863 Transcript_2788/m.9863 type:complete len:289 (-) Transcript_2788:823-1689(-)
MAGEGDARLLEELESQLSDASDYMPSLGFDSGSSGRNAASPARSEPATTSRGGRRWFRTRPYDPEARRLQRADRDGGSCPPRVSSSAHRLEAARIREAAVSMAAAAQQRQSVARQRERSVAPRPIDSLKSALIDSKVAPFVATVPRVLPPPLGAAVVRDFRPGKACGRPRCRIRAVAWNVERGYRLGAVIAALRREAADVLLLSEVDVGCERSQMVDVGAEIAAALGLVLVFATEKIFVNVENKGGRLEAMGDVCIEDDADAFGGVEGIAVLSRYDVVGAPLSARASD